MNSNPKKSGLGKYAGVHGVVFKNDVMPAAPSHYQDDLIQKACYFIESNFNQKLSLTEVAETLHLSTPYFSKLFKRKTGLNFVNYLLKIRMFY